MTCTNWGKSNDELSHTLPFKSLVDVSLTIIQALSYGFFSYALHDFNKSHPEDLMTTPWKYVVFHVVQVCSISTNHTSDLWNYVTSPDKTYTTWDIVDTQFSSVHIKVNVYNKYTLSIPNKKQI